jgi:hypothetical protein
LAGIAQLSQLTSLELEYLHHSQVEELLEVLAQHLPLRVLRLNDHDDLPTLELSHLTQLHEFRAGCEVDAIFPAQLQQLELGYIAESPQVESLMQLRHLRCLKLTVSIDEPALLMRLTQLPALQQLSLAYTWSVSVVATAATWPQLPQLHELVMNCEDDDFEEGLPDRQQWQNIMDSVAASTNLSKLALDVLIDPEVDAYEEPAGGPDDSIQHVAACAKQLTSLRQLQDLRINYSLCKPLVHIKHMSGDALALTALTGLTRLVLAHAGACVGDLAATAIAGSCKQLRHLDLQRCRLGSSMACLANICHLSQLTELRLEGNAGLTQQGLMLLTGLKQLQQLGVDSTADITDGVINSFWAAVRGQL